MNEPRSAPPDDIGPPEWFGEFVCRRSCPECEGRVWIPNWAIQQDEICPHARPWSIVRRCAFEISEAWWRIRWTMRHRAELAWERRPRWLRRWWWTDDVPF